MGAAPRLSADILATRLEQLPAEGGIDRSAVRTLLAETVPEHAVVDVATRGGGRWLAHAVLGGDGRVVDEDHNHFLRVLATDRGPAAAAAAVRERALVFRAYTGEQWYFAIPYDEAPEGFLQIELKRYTAHDFRPRLTGNVWPRVEDLITAVEEEGSDAPATGPDGVRLAGVTDIAAHLARCRADWAQRERDRLERLRRTKVIRQDPELGRIERPYAEFFPDAMRPQPDRLERLFRDWAESSAGECCFARHWFLDPLHELMDASMPDGIPQWADGPDLPKLKATEFDDIDALARALEAFDTQAGYPFAWYFYMLHGNRLGSDVGEVVVDALREERLTFPARDAQVVLRWGRTPYAF